MDDLISRQAALDAIHRDANPFLEYAAKQIEQLPSAQRTGRWIIEYNPKIRWYRVTCSECGEDVTSVIPLIGFFPNVKPLWDFCPNCGCAMKGEDDGNQS